MTQVVQIPIEQWQRIERVLLMHEQPIPDVLSLAEFKKYVANESTWKRWKVEHPDWFEPFGNGEKKQHWRFKYWMYSKKKR